MELSGQDQRGPAGQPSWSGLGRGQGDLQEDRKQEVTLLEGKECAGASTGWKAQDLQLSGREDRPLPLPVLRGGGEAGGGAVCPGHPPWE